MSKNRNKGGARPQNDGSGGALTVSDSTGSAEGKAPEGGESGAAEAAAPDPFADVPVTKIGDDVEFSDFSDTPTADPRKYANVHAAAVGDRLPTVKGWKHERAMLVPGTNRKEFKQGSVYGTIQQIVNAAGRTGIPAYVVATKLRRLQVGNKRSHYCGTGEVAQLPPIGWAEGWLNTAITKNIAGVHPTKQAPALREEVTEGEANVNKAESQGKLAANG
jgi:hypothetical protein